jgi:hypothetical protein
MWAVEVAFVEGGGDFLGRGRRGCLDGAGRCDALSIDARPVVARLAQGFLSEWAIVTMVDIDTVVR